MKIDIAVCGTEGVGKTTTVKLIEKMLTDAGYSTRRIAFMQLPFNHFTSPHRWMARSAKRAAGFKEGASMSQYDEQLRTLLDVKPETLSLAYFFVFVFRILAFRTVFAFRPRRQVIIFERYFYDNIVNKTAQSRLQLLLESLMLAITPKPKVLFLLKTDADEMVKRRPRISRENVQTILARYAALKRKIASAVTIDTMSGVPLLEAHVRGELRDYLR